MAQRRSIYWEPCVGVGEGAQLDYWGPEQVEMGRFGSKAARVVVVFTVRSSLVPARDQTSQSDRENEFVTKQFYSTSHSMSSSAS